MQNSTLYLVQSHYANTQAQLKRLDLLLQDHDAIVMMGEAILHIHLIQTTHQVYVLENEKPLLTAKTAQIINYAEFADLVLHYNTVIRIA